MQSTRLGHHAKALAKLLSVRRLMFSSASDEMHNDVENYTVSMGMQ